MKSELNVVVHDGDGPPMLLVHGMLASRSQWLLNLPVLAEFVQPVTIELFGHHLSPSPTDSANYLPENYVSLFEGIREGLEIDQWFVGGCSLGAALSMRYALTHPTRVLGQFFTNSSSAFADAQTVSMWQANSKPSYERVLQGGRQAIDRIPVHPRHGKHLPARIKAALIEDSVSHDVQGIAATMRWTSPGASVRDRLHELSMPSMLLCGVYERRFKPLREVARTRIAQLTIHDLPAGHAVNMEAADEFNEHVRTFVAKHAKASSYAA